MRVASTLEKPARSTHEGLHLLYHELRPGGSEYSYVCDSANFESQVDLFIQLRKAESGSLWPEVTFDDGHMSDFEFALPILQSRGLIARFFITVGWTGNRRGYMGWRELRTLHESGQLIGAHGWSHTLLTECSSDDLKKELGDARLMLEDKLGTSITTMSLPGGRYNRRVIAACGEAGYKQIYTSIPKADTLPAGFMVGRLNIRGDMTLEWIRSVLQPGNAVLSSLERQYRMKAGAKKVLGDRLYESLWAILNRKERNSGGAGDDSE